jgi:peptide/nickel transport system ATP-binding protein
MTASPLQGSQVKVPLLSVEGLSADYGRRRIGAASSNRRGVRALDDVNLAINGGEILALVGESGCGKSTLAKVITGLKAPTTGQLLLHGSAVQFRRTRKTRKTLARSIQMVFQDPHASLSPRQTVSYLLREPYTIHRTPEDEQTPPAQLLSWVGLAEEQLGKYAHELSGGQARRVGIARALALSPSLVVADEPTAGLDVSAASSILNLLQRLVGESGLSCLLITHNLNVVSYVADRIAVMYLGQIVEVGDTDNVVTNPLHPYTRALLSSAATLNPANRRGHRDKRLMGEIPSAANPPSGCRFHTRCPYADDLCRGTMPLLTRGESAERQVRCHHWAELRTDTSLRGTLVEATNTRGDTGP